MVGVAALVATLAACGGSAADPLAPPVVTPTVTVRASAAQLTVSAGARSELPITIERGRGFSGVVELALDGAPPGVAGTFTPSPVPANAAGATLRLDVAPTVAAGSYVMSVRARASGAPDATVPLTVVVDRGAPVPGVALTLAPSAVVLQQGGTVGVRVSVARLNGLTGPVTVAASDLPPLVTAAPLTIAGDTATLLLTADAAAAAGSYSPTVRATAAGGVTQQATLPLTITAAPPTGAFSLGLAPSAITVAPGGIGEATVQVRRSGGFAGGVLVTVNSAPNGITVDLPSGPVTEASTAMAVRVAPNVTSGTYTVVLRGSAAGLPDQLTSLQIAVQAATAPPGYVIGVSPGSITLAQGTSATATVTLARNSGYAGAIAVVATTTVPGLTVDAPAAATTGSSVALVVRAASDVVPGTHTVTVRASADGLLDRVTTFLVVVTPPVVAPGFSLDVTPTSVVLQRGASVTARVVATRRGGFALPIALAVTGLPSGVTADAPTLVGDTATVTLTAGAVATTGSYALTITGTGSGLGAQTAALQLTVSPATPTGAFTLTFTPATATTTPNGRATATVTIDRTGGLTAPVLLTPDAVPTGLTLTLPNAPVSGASASVDVAVAAGVAAGTYTVRVRGSVTGLTDQFATLTVTVAPAVTPGFTLAPAAPGLVVQAGASGTITVGLARQGGFTGPVAVAVSGLPSGVTAAPLSITADADVLTLTATSAAVPGNYSLTLTGTATGVATQTVALQLTVSAAPPTGGFSLAVSPATLSVVQGGTGSSTVTLTRTGGFTGSILVTTSGAPAGLTVDAPVTAVAGGSTVLTVTVGASVAPGSYPVTVRGSVIGLQDQTTTLTITVTAAPVGGFTLAASPTSVSVAQGASGSATIAVARTAPFSGAVALATSGAPAGMTVTLTPASITGTSATLGIAVGTGVAVGSYTLTVSGTGTGVTAQQTTLTVQVTPGATNAVTYTFCAPDLPVWLAYQDNGGAWTRVTPTGGGTTFAFNVSSRGGVAYVTQTGSRYDLTVFYGTAAELQSGGSLPCLLIPIGTKQHTGTTTNVAGSEVAFVSLGTAFASTVGAGSFTLDSVPSGGQTLVASRSGVDGGTNMLLANSLIVRRGVNLSAGAAIPALDFNGAEAFAPTLATLTISNLGADSAIVGVGLSAGTIGAASYSFTLGLGSHRYAGLPAGRLQGSDLQSLVALAEPPNTTTSGRGVLLYFRSVADRTVTLGPTLSAPSVSSVTGAGYPRLRATLAAQTEYNRAAQAFFTQADRGALVTVTAGYAGGAPTAWDVSIPDFGGSAAFDATWALRSGVNTRWTIETRGGTFVPELGVAPTDGSTMRFANATGNTTAAAALRAARLAPAERTLEARVTRARSALRIAR